MNSAYCTLNDRLYDAAEFAQLPPAILESHRRALLCYSCRREAFFRSASSSGRGPCFGARPHAADCPEATVDAGTWGMGGAEVDEPILNAAGHIVIDLPPLDAQPNDAELGGAEQRRRGAGRVFGGEGGATANATRRRLSSLLRRLNNDPHFQFTETVIRPPGGQLPTTVRDFFVSFERSAERAAAKFKGLWGLITDASYDQNGSLWLNTGNRSAVSFVIDADLAAAFLDRWGLKNLEMLAGAQALILATPIWSPRGKVYASIRDLRFAVLDVT